MTDEPHAREVVAGGTVVRPGLGRLRYFATRFEGVRVEGLSRMREWVSFQGCEFAECDFVDCDLDGSFCGALADPAAASTFTGCRFVRCRLADAYLGGARLERCVFEDCDFDGVFFVSTDLVENRFVGLVKSLSIAARSSEYSAPPPNHKVKLPPRENEVRGNDFTAAELQGLGLREGCGSTSSRGLVARSTSWLTGSHSASRPRERRCPPPSPLRTEPSR